MGGHLISLFVWLLRGYSVHKITKDIEAAKQEEIEKIKKLEKELQDFDSALRKQLFRLDSKKSEDERAFLQKEIDEAKKKMEEISDTQKTVIKRTPIIQQDEVVGYRDELVRVTLTQFEILENEKERARLQVIIYENQLRLRQLEETGSKNKLQSGYTPLREGQGVGSPPIDVQGKMPTPEYAPTTDPKSQFGVGSTGWGTISQVPLKDLKKLKGANKEQMEEKSKEMQAFVSAFDSGMQAVGQGINQWVGGAFRRSFGEANSLLEIFFQNFTNQLAQIGIQAGIGALFGALGIPVPSGKIGSSPVPSGPFSNSPIMEQATNMNLRGASSQGFHNMQLTTKISGSDLYIVLEKGKSNLLGRSLR